MELKENLVGEWRVASQTIDDAVCYSIVRTKDTSQPEHSGNREYYDEEMDFFTDKDEAVQFANGLNGVEEEPTKPNIFQRIDDIKRRLQVIEECDWEKMSDRELDRQDRVAVALMQELEELEELAKDVEEPKKGAKISTTIRIDSSELDIAQAKVDKLLNTIKELTEVTRELNIRFINADEIVSELTTAIEEAVANVETQKIANYEIFDTLTTKYNQYAIGFNDNPNTPTPYATWERNLAKDGDGEPQWQLGHYFATKAEAICDFDKRYMEGE